MRSLYEFLFTKQHKAWLIRGLILLFTALYVSLIFNNNIWTDEGFTMQLIRSGGLREITAGTAADVHPPLYYYWAKLFMILGGDTLIAQKVAVIIPQVLLLVYLGTVVRRHLGDGVAFLSILFLTCIPCSMEFAVQVRMYSMAILFVTICCVSAYLSFERGSRRDLASYALSGLAAAYTHYFAFVAVGFIALVFLIRLVVRYNSRKRMGIDETMHTGASIRDWFLTAGLMILGYLPWVPTVIRQITNVNKSYWIPAITGNTVLGYFTWTFGLKESFLGIPGKALMILSTGFFLVCLVVSGVLMIRRLGRETRINGLGLCCMLIPTLVCVFGVVVSVLPGHNPIYRDQYIYPSLGMLALAYAIGMRKFLDRSKGMKGKILVSVVTLVTLFIGALQYRECYHQEYRSSYLGETMTFFAENVGEEDPILYNFEAYGFIYEYYWPKERLTYYEDFEWDQEYEAAWFLATPNMGVPDDITWLMYGLGIEDMGHYGIEQNEFEIYKVTHLH